jgi:hypothetical protein
MTNPELLIEDIKKLQDGGFRVGVYAVNSPNPLDAALITQMQFRCLNAGIDFRIKDYTGLFEGRDRLGNPFSILYGDYSKYPDSIFQEKTREVICRTPELLIAPDGKIYKCHRDLYSREFTIGNIIDENFKPEYKYRECTSYGKCHPCDVKGKTSHKQEIGYTTVDIVDKK